MRIRPASAADLPALAAFDSVAAQDQTRTGQIARWIADQHCWLLEEGQAPRAYLALTNSFFGRPFVEMLMVDSDLRRHGYGQKLLEHAVAAHPDLWTSTNQSNLPMLALLARAGFVRSGIVEGLDEGDPELIFRHHPPLVE